MKSTPVHVESMKQDAPECEFTVTLDKDGGGTLGLDLNPGFSAHCLQVKKVGPDGLVAKWNSDNPHLAISDEDLLVEVNSVRGDRGAILSKLRDDQKLDIRVVPKLHGAAILLKLKEEQELKDQKLKEMYEIAIRAAGDGNVNVLRRLFSPTGNVYTVHVAEHLQESASKAGYSSAAPSLHVSFFKLSGEESFTYELGFAATVWDLERKLWGDDYGVPMVTFNGRNEVQGNQILKLFPELTVKEIIVPCPRLINGWIRMRKMDPSPMDEAVRKGQAESLRALKELGAKIEGSHAIEAIKCDRLDMLCLIKDLGVELNDQSHRLVELCASLGKAEALRTLHVNGVDIFAPCLMFPYSLTVCHLAAQHGHTECLRLWKELGGDINVTCEIVKGHQTAAVWAVDHDQMISLQVLEELGADLSGVEPCLAQRSLASYSAAVKHLLHPDIPIQQYYSGPCGVIFPDLGQTNVKDKLEDGDVRTLDIALGKVMDFLMGITFVPCSDVREIESVEKEFDTVVNPILQKAYQSAGGTEMPELGDVRRDIRAWKQSRSATN